MNYLNKRNNLLDDSVNYTGEFSDNLRISQASQEQDVMSDDSRNEFGISYPARLRNNVMMVRRFNGYLSETQDEAMEAFNKRQIRQSAMNIVKKLFSPRENSFRL